MAFKNDCSAINYCCSFRKFSKFLKYWKHSQQKSVLLELLQAKNRLIDKGLGAESLQSLKFVRKVRNFQASLFQFLVSYKFYELRRNSNPFIIIYCSPNIACNAKHLGKLVKGDATNKLTPHACAPFAQNKASCSPQCPLRITMLDHCASLVNNEHWFAHSFACLHCIRLLTGGFLRRIYTL